jgi:N-acetyl-anhydromuramyl-L-alanine amidase AmpD
MIQPLRARWLIAPLGLVFVAIGCTHTHVGDRVERKGDEIMVAGQLFHTGAPVVLWTDPGGYDAYRTERRFVSWDRASYEASKEEVPEIAKNGPARYGPRRSQVDDQTFQRVRGGGWDLKTLQDCVDQFVYHYDVAGVSQSCFRTLHDQRALSVQFMLDIDGTIYQTLDLKERAWQATKANSRSIGIEIANIGAYSLKGTSAEQQEHNPLSQWYRKDENGRTRIVLPAYLQKNSGVRTPNFVGHPARNEPIVGEIQGRQLQQYDLTPQQYDSLIKLTAAVCTALPKITCDGPRDSSGAIINHTLPDDRYDRYQGLLGHYHVQDNKTDPGPAFDWERVIKGARKLMSAKALAANSAENGHPALPKNDSPSMAPSTTQPSTNRAMSGGRRGFRRGASQPATAPSTNP